MNKQIFDKSLDRVYLNETEKASIGVFDVKFTIS